MISVQRWRFDQTDGSGRLDGERSGFSSAAHRVRFHGNDGKILIASGTGPRTLWLFSVNSVFNEILQNTRVLSFVD